MDDGTWASGRWQVKDGKADEFIQRWSEWLRLSSQGISGFRSARLLRAEDDPQRFTSVSNWDDEASRDAWAKSPAYGEGIESVKALCDEFMGGNFEAAAVISPR
jgi:heme-degrading monooxygenase HmoA